MAEMDRPRTEAVAAALPATARATVSLPGGRGEVREFDVVAASSDEGWLQVIASGICGTDVGLFARGLHSPTVLGHHVVGRVASIGAHAASRRGLAVGDRVVLEEYLPCGNCPTCATGPYRLCPETDVWGGGRRVGMLPVAERPGLTGGNAEYTFLPVNAVVHRLPDDLEDGLAAWVLPYANAIDWVTGAGALRPGDNCLVLGPGYHGLAVVAAARWAGAARVVVTGLRRDAERLAMAEALGASPVVVDDEPGVAAVIGKQLGGAAAVVVDTVGGDASVLGPAVDGLGHGGRLVLTSPKQPATVAIDSASVVRKGLRIAGVRGRSPEAISTAIASLADGTSRLAAVPTATVDLDGTTDMLTRLASGRGPESPHVVVCP